MHLASVSLQWSSHCWICMREIVTLVNIKHECKAEYNTFSSMFWEQLPGVTSVCCKWAQFTAWHMDMYVTPFAPQTSSPVVYSHLHNSQAKIPWVCLVTCGGYSTKWHTTVIVISLLIPQSCHSEVLSYYTSGSITYAWLQIACITQ